MKWSFASPTLWRNGREVLFWTEQGIFCSWAFLKNSQREILLEELLQILKTEMLL